MGKNLLDFVLRLRDVKIDPKVFQKISRSVAGIPAAFQDMATGAKKADGAMQKFSKTTQKSAAHIGQMGDAARKFVQRMAQFAILLPAFATLNKALQGGAKFLGDFEEAISKVVRVNKEFGKDITALKSRIFSLGQTFGASATEIAATVQVFAQAGFNMEEALAKASAATLASKVTTLDLAGAQEFLIATSKIFGDQAADNVAVLDKLSAIEDAVAVNASDVTQAFQRGGQALAFFTKNIDVSVALIAALRDQTRKTGAEIGTFYKTLVARITAVGDARSAVEKLGIAITDLRGNIRPGLQILNELKEVFDSLTESQQATLAKQVAGIRQGEAFRGAMASIAKANELVQISTESAGRSEEKRQLQINNLNEVMKRSLATLQELDDLVGQAGLLELFKDASVLVGGFAITLREVLKITNAIGVTLTPLLAVLASFVGKKIFGAGGAIKGAVTGLAAMGRGGGGGVGAGGAQMKALTAQMQALTSVVQQSSLAHQQATLVTQAGSREGIFARLKSEENTAATQRSTAAKRVDASALKQHSRFLGLSARGAKAVADSQIAQLRATKASAATGIGAVVGLSILGTALERHASTLDKDSDKAEKHAAELAASTVNAASMGLAIGAINAKAGVVVGTLQLLADVTAKLIPLIQDEFKARDELKARGGVETGGGGNRIFAGPAGGEVGFRETLRGGGRQAEAIISAFTRGIDQAKGDITQAGGEIARILGEEVGTTFGLSVRDAVQDFLKTDVPEGSPSLRRDFASPQVARDIIFASDKFADLQKEIEETGLTVAVQGKLWERLGASTEAVNRELDKLAEFGTALKALTDFDALIRSENKLFSTRQELTNLTARGANIFADNIAQRREELQLVQNTADVVGRSLNTAFQQIMQFPTDFGFDEVNGERDARQFVEGFQQALRASEAGNRQAIEDFLDFSDLTADQKKVADSLRGLAEQRLDAELELKKAIIKVEEDRQRRALAASQTRIAIEDRTAQAIQNSSKKLIEFGVGLNNAQQNLSALASLTQEEFQAIIDGVSDLPKAVQDAVLAFAGGDVQKATQDARIASEGFAVSLGALQTKLDQAKEDMASVLPDENKVRRTGESVNDLSKRINDLNSQIEETVTGRDIDLASRNLEVNRALKDAEEKAAEAAEQLRKQMESLSIAEINMSEGLRNATVEFGKFKQAKIAELLKEEADAQNELKSAHQDVISSTEALDQTFLEFRRAVFEFNSEMASAQVQVNLLQLRISSLGGGVAGFNERLGALNNAFNSVLRDANITLERRIELERKLAEETLEFLQETRNAIVDAGLAIFGQDAAANRELAEGIAGLNVVASKLGGSFDDFLRLGPEQFKQVSQDLLSLPSDLRQKMLSALGTLPGTTGLGGFSVEELRNALGQVGAGISPEMGLPSLEEILTKESEQIQKLQELALRDAELQGVMISEASKQLAVAEEQLMMSQINEERAREKLEEVRATVVEQATFLEAAEKQRDILTNRIIDATDAVSIREIQAQADEFAQQNFKFDDISGKLSSLVQAVAGLQGSVISAQAAVGGARGFIPNYARGKLTPREASSMLKAAAREKRAMPAGAGLAVANTSEAIVPMRAGGYIPNYQRGNAGAAVDTNILAKKLDRVLDQLEVIASINSNIAATSATVPATVGGGSVDINLVTQQNGTVVVSGLENLAEQIRVAIVQAQENNASAVVGPVSDAVASIFEVLRTRGLISSTGQPF